MSFVAFRVDLLSAFGFLLAWRGREKGNISTHSFLNILAVDWRSIREYEKN